MDIFSIRGVYVGLDAADPMAEFMPDLAHA